MKTRLGFSLFVLISVLIGCQKDNQKDDLNRELISTKWYLQSIQNTDTQNEDIVPGNLLGMNVVFSDSSKLHAISSCNVFYGSFITKDPDLISVTSLVSTKKYCADSNIIFWESLFYENLKNSGKYILKDGTLSIFTTENTVMIFK